MATENGVELFRSSYCNTTGPAYETPFETGFMRKLGGGAYGIYVSNTEVMKVNNSLINGITKGAVRILNSRGVTFMNTTISNNNPSIPLVNFYATGSYVTFKNVSIIDNKRNPASTFQNSERLFAVGNNTMILEDCTIQNNAGYKTLGVGPNNVKRCQIQGVSVP